MAVTMISMIGSETVLPMFVQNLLNKPALDSGLILLPGAIVMAIMSMTSGAMYEKFGAKPSYHRNVNCNHNNFVFCGDGCSNC